MMEKIKYFFEYFKYLDNPFSVLAFKFSLKKECMVKIKNFNEKIDLKSIVALDTLMGGLAKVMPENYVDFIKYIKDIDNDNEFVIMDGIKFNNIHNSCFKKEHSGEYIMHLEEYFCEDDFNIIDFQDRFVIDIGANVADRTLYFVKHGAKSVIGFEPVKHLYELGLDNISANPELKNNIVFINKAVGGKRSNIY